MLLVRRPVAGREQEVGDAEGDADQHEVDEHLDEPPRREEDLAQQHGPVGRVRAGPVEVGEEARELHEHDEGDEHADEGHAAVVVGRVGEAGGAEAGGDDREQDDRPFLAEAAAGEPV